VTRPYYLVPARCALCRVPRAVTRLQGTALHGRGLDGTAGKDPGMGPAMRSMRRRPSLRVSRKSRAAIRLVRSVLGSIPGASTTRPRRRPYLRCGVCPGCDLVNLARLSGAACFCELEYRLRRGSWRASGGVRTDRRALAEPGNRARGQQPSGRPMRAGRAAAGGHPGDRSRSLRWPQRDPADRPQTRTPQPLPEAARRGTEAVPRRASGRGIAAGVAGRVVRAGAMPSRLRKTG